MKQEEINLNPEYGFLNNRNFSFIKENVERLGQKLDKEDLAGIDSLLKANKSYIIAYFHNFFSLNEKKSLKEIELIINRGFSGFDGEDDEETKEIEKVFRIFHNFLKKYGWEICWNIESFVEQYKGN